MQRIPVFLCTIVFLTLASCGGGSGGGGNMPRSLAEAVSRQAMVSRELQSLFEELIAEQNAANTALDEGRYGDFDAYWLQRYPDWVDRLDKTAKDFRDAEEGVMLFAPTPQTASGGMDAKFVPLPLVLLAVSTITFIAAEEKKRAARLNDPVPEDERQQLIEARARYLREQKGMDATQAEFRAIVDVEELQTLQGLANGIERARQVVVEFATDAFAGYLPKLAQGAIELVDSAGKIDEIRQNTTVLLSDEGCDVAQQRQDGIQPKIDAFPVCRIFFCDPGDLRCDNVPEGRWATAVLSQDFVRDEPVVPVTGGQTSVAQATLLTPQEVENSGTGSNGGGAGDFNEVREVVFVLDIFASGIRFEPGNPQGVPETRWVTAMEESLLPLAPTSCMPTGQVPEFGFAFERERFGARDGTSTRIKALAQGLIRASDCGRLNRLSLFRREEARDDPGHDFESFVVEFSNVPQAVMRGGNDFNSAERIVYEWEGHDVCAALEHFDYFADNSDFVAEVASCDELSYAAIAFDR